MYFGNDSYKKYTFQVIRKKTKPHTNPSLSLDRIKPSDLSGKNSTQSPKFSTSFSLLFSQGSLPEFNEKITCS